MSFQTTQEGKFTTLNEVVALTFHCQFDCFENDHVISTITFAAQIKQ